MKKVLTLPFMISGFFHQALRLVRAEFPAETTDLPALVASCWASGVRLMHGRDRPTTSLGGRDTRHVLLLMILFVDRVIGRGDGLIITRIGLVLAHWAKLDIIVRTRLLLLATLVAEAAAFDNPAADHRILGEEADSVDDYQEDHEGSYNDAGDGSWV